MQIKAETTQNTGSVYPSQLSLLLVLKLAEEQHFV